MSSRVSSRSCLALAFLVGLVTGPFTSNTFAQLAKRTPNGLALVTRTTVDPCAVASEDQLRQVLELGIGSAFPIKHGKKGEHVTLSRPDLRGFSCPNLTLEMRLRVRYQKTRGFPQYSTSGTARIRSPVAVRVNHTPVRRGAKLAASQMQSADVCLTDVDVIALNLRRVPNWLDNTWIRKIINEKLSNQHCQDVTGWVKLYLTAGNDLHAGSS